MPFVAVISAVTLALLVLLAGFVSSPEAPTPPVLLEELIVTEPILVEPNVEEETLIGSTEPKLKTVVTKSKSVQITSTEESPLATTSVEASIITIATTTQIVATTTSQEKVSDSSSKRGQKSHSVQEETTTLIATEPPPKIPKEAQEPSYILAPAGQKASLKISSASDANPQFVSAAISPLHVYVGETQTFTVKVKSEDPITSVVATTELDNETFELSLLETGSDASGTTFSASWIVFDTHVETYHTTFTAETDGGDENSFTLAWSDPCPGITQGNNSSLSGSCTVSSVSGLDGGNFTIPSGTTLTLNSGTTWAWNPGTSVFVDGTIVTTGTAQLKKGYLFYSGSSNDNANTTTLVFDTASTKSGHVRAGTWFHFTPVYGAGLTAVQYSNVVTIGGIANGSSVTLVDSGQGETQVAMSINGGAWVTSGTMNPGDTLGIKLRPGGDYLTTYWAQATVGGSSSIFEVTTRDDPGGGGCEFECP